MISPRVTMTHLAARRKGAPTYELAAPVLQKPTPVREKPAPVEKQASAEEKTRETMIREAAYLFAERRGFLPGRELEDWLAAEKEVDERLTRRATQHR